MQGDDIKELKVALIYPCEIIRQGIGALFKQSGINDVSLFNTCASFLDQPDIKPADLILVHYSQCNITGNIKHIVEATGAHVALLASSDTFHQDSYKDIYNRLSEGISGFLDMDEPVNTFLSELEEIAVGDIVISSKFAKNVVQKTDIVIENLYEVLSQRELQILDLIAAGSTNLEIGQELSISPHTVKGHVTNILAKLDLKNRQQAVAYIMKKRLSNQ